MKYYFSRVFFLPLFILQITTSFSQKLESTSQLAVVPFREDYLNSDETDYSKVLAERVLSAVQQSNRFVVIDRIDFEKILAEVALWEGEHKDDFEKTDNSARAKSRVSDEQKKDFKKWDVGDLSWYGQRLRANFLLTGSLSKPEPGIMITTGSYKATIGFTIKVINVATNKIYISESFQVKAGSLTDIYSTSGEAIIAALSNIEEPVKQFVDKYFPVHAKYLRTERLVKSTMKEALVNAGIDKGLRTGQRLDAILIDTLNSGNLPPEVVGLAEVIDVQPDHARVKILKAKINLEGIENKANILYFRSKADD
ncbi:MAG: hypothetical protein R3D58_04765 [Saprospiraceae bacterium]